MEFHNYCKDMKKIPSGSLCEVREYFTCEGRAVLFYHEVVIINKKQKTI